MSYPTAPPAELGKPGEEDHPPAYNSMNYNTSYGMAGSQPAAAFPASTVIVMPPQVFYGSYPVLVACPHCSAQGLSRVEHSPGGLTWLLCLGIFLFGCTLGCCLIPFCVDAAQDATHHCSSCGRVLGHHSPFRGGATFHSTAAVHPQGTTVVVAPN